MSWKKTFYEGLKSGIPIGLGYLPVSFTFGFLAVSGGLPVWVAVYIADELNERRTVRRDKPDSGGGWVL